MLRPRVPCQRVLSMQSNLRGHLLPQRTVSSTLLALTLAFGAAAFAQLTPPPVSVEAEQADHNTTTREAVQPADHDSHSWKTAQLLGASQHKLKIITADQPERKQTCRVKSFTQDQLVCARGIGGSRSFTPEKLVAVIVPGDGGLRVPLFIGFNVGLGAAIWGTVVLAAACPACAAATALAALICFSAAGVVAYADDEPDRVLFLTADSELRRKAGYSGLVE